MQFIAENDRSHSALLTGMRAAILASFVGCGYISTKSHIIASKCGHLALSQGSPLLGVIGFGQSAGDCLSQVGPFHQSGCCRSSDGLRPLVVILRMVIWECLAPI